MNLHPYTVPIDEFKKEKPYYQVPKQGKFILNQYRITRTPYDKCSGTKSLSNLDTLNLSCASV